MMNCPEPSVMALSWITPSRRSSTIAPGALLPAMTASPPGSIRTMSKAGVMSAFSERSKPGSSVPRFHGQVPHRPWCVLPGELPTALRAIRIQEKLPLRPPQPETSRPVGIWVRPA